MGRLRQLFRPRSRHRPAFPGGRRLIPPPKHPIVTCSRSRSLSPGVNFMITLTRRQARTLRGVFRRSVLGIPHRRPIPPLVFRVDGTEVRAQHRYVALAVEHVFASDPAPPEALALPLDALADIEGP